MNRIQRLAAAVAELRAGKVAQSAAPLAAKELREAGFKVYPFPDGDGLAVESAPGLLTKLDEIRTRGIRPALVCILRDLLQEDVDGAMAAVGNGDRADGAGAPSSVGPATPGARVTDPTTKNGSKHV